MTEVACSTPLYTYDPLPEGRFIRYLALAPGEGDDALRCSIHTTSLDTAPSYEAISYVWGSNVKDHQVLCGHSALHITGNLHDALFQVRLKDQPRNLWADSICIHQDDRKEQGHQVDLMGDIYSKASTTLICLGPDPGGHAEGVVTLLQETTEMIFDTIYLRGLGKVGGKTGNFPWADLSDPLLHNPRWECFQQLVEQPWFERGWVVQEAALSTNAEVIWGTHAFDWHDLLLVHRWASRRIPGAGSKSVFWWTGEINKLHWEAFRRRDADLFELFGLSYRYDEGGMPLHHVLRGGRSFEFADPRDRIYGLLNLGCIPGGNAFHIQSDYECDVRDVYRNFAVQYIKATKNVLLLMTVEPQPSDLEDPSLESWVPRWNNWVYQFTLNNSPSGDDRLTRDFFTNIMDYVPSPEVLSDNTLRVRGVSLDRVKFTSGAFLNDETEDKILDTFGRFLTQCLGNEQLVYAKECIPRLLAKTLLAGTKFGEKAHVWDRHQARFLASVFRRGFPSGLIDVARLEQQAVDGNVQHFLDGLLEVAHNRCLVVTERGYVALAPSLAVPGDVLAILFGARAPFGLRPVGSGQYKLLGECCIPARAADGDRFPWLGEDGRKDWVEWGAEEQDILIR
jgi:hypothetical protein